MADLIITQCQRFEHSVEGRYIKTSYYYQYYTACTAAQIGGL